MSLPSYEYRCPKCTSVLNPNVRVVLVARFGDDSGLVLMSSQLGDYQLICDKGFCHQVQKGDLVDFCCPVCSESLTSETMDHFTELQMTDPARPDDHPAMIRFSRVCEEHATFVYDGESVHEFGEEARLFHERMTLEGDWGW